MRDLVEGQRAWDARATEANKQEGFRGWHERGYVPRRDSPNLTQFITYHLADSFPAALRSEWEALVKIEDDRKRRIELEAYLDKGRDNCRLRLPEIAELCENAFRHFHRERYTLKAGCVMPNHVHVLVLVTTVPMSEFVQSWKGYTSYRCNQLLGLDDPSFWADGYWDTYTRDTDQERRTVRYIENNPAKAGFVGDLKAWLRSSARFRDKYGVLRLPATGKSGK